MRLILWWKVTYTPRQYLQLGLHLTRGIRQVKEKGVFVKIRYVGNCLMTSFGNVHPQFFRPDDLYREVIYLSLQPKTGTYIFNNGPCVRDMHVVTKF